MQKPTETARGYFWIEPVIDQAAIHSYARESGVPIPVAALLLRRGVAASDAKAFLSPKLKHLLPDPSLFADLDPAVEHIAEAITQKKKVVVFADYDVDGATSAAQLIRYFRHFGLVLDLYVPDRLKEGFGPSPAAFEHLKQKGYDLVITVDCGAAATEALKTAAEISLPVIVLDHHLMGPPSSDCVALVNPNRSDCQSGQGHLAAAGVVFMILVGLNRYFRTTQSIQVAQLPDLMSFLDLCALGTLCDMAPLKSLNRAFVQQGLTLIQATPPSSFLALSQVTGRSAPKSVSDLTFGIGPQLNAGGRIGDPWLATELLATTELGEAMPKAELLFNLNEQRKEIEQSILDACRRSVESAKQQKSDDPIIVISGEGWHPGVIGIVAGRLKDEFHKPTVIIGHGTEFGNLAKGSARSVQGVNIGELLSNAQAEGIIVSGGGHAMAGGLSLQVSRIDELRSFLNNTVGETVKTLQQARHLEIDGVLLCSAINRELVDTVEQCGPFGAGAPKPLFLVRDVSLARQRVVGRGHVSLQLEDGSGKTDAISWRSSDRPIGDLLLSGQRVDVVGHITPNEWRGPQAAQLEIVDARPVL